MSWGYRKHFFIMIYNEKKAKRSSIIHNHRQRKKRRSIHKVILRRNSAPLTIWNPKGLIDFRINQEQAPHHPRSQHTRQTCQTPQISSERDDRCSQKQSKLSNWELQTNSQHAQHTHNQTRLDSIYGNFILAVHWGRRDSWLHLQQLLGL